jgi:hypothetical protein
MCRGARERMLALAERRHIMIEFQHRIEIDRSSAGVFARLLAGLTVTVVLLAVPASAVAAAPDEPAGGTAASCPGVAFSDHATGNADTKMREVIHEEVPFFLELTGFRNVGQLARLFAALHVDSHGGCEEALLKAVGL